MKKRDSAPAGWYHDPAFRFNQRFWDGETWTDRVASGTTELNDPLGVKKISVHYSPAGVFSETPKEWGGREVNKNDSGWVTSGEEYRQELRKAKEQGYGKTSIVTGGEVQKDDSGWVTSGEEYRQELRKAKEQGYGETSLVTIFWRSACIIGPLSLLLSLTSGRIGGESYGDGNFENAAFGIDLVLYPVRNGVVFGGLIVGVVALVRKRRKGKG